MENKNIINLELIILFFRFPSRSCNFTCIIAATRDVTHTNIIQLVKKIRN